MTVSLVKEVHQRLAEIIEPGDLCLDTTAGNGFDTLFLAQRAGDAGTVHAMDVQKNALRSTERLLEQSDVRERVTTHLTCHSKMETVLPGNAKGRIRAITFNLGYLPKGDKSITTRKETTLPAVRNAYDWLAGNGVLSVLCYRGHPGGKAEEEGIRKLIETCKWNGERLVGNNSDTSPVLHWIVKA